MPKKANAKKIASQEWTNIKSLNAATKEGKYVIARVEKSLGFCQFLCQAELPQGGIIPVTALVRGKMKGGRNAPSRVEVGCYVLVDGDLTKLVEVVGVVNRQEGFNKLKNSGRVSRTLMEGVAEMDDFFDRSEEERSDEADEEEFNLWADSADVVVKPLAPKAKRASKADEEYKRLEAELAAKFAAEVAAEREEERVLAALQNRAVPATWEDEVDIDAI